MFTISGSTPAQRRQWLLAGVLVAVGLGLLLLTLAGCTQASPPVSRAQEPADTADTGIITADETPGTEPPVAGDATPVDRAPAAVLPLVTIEALALYVTGGDSVQFRLSADPAPAAPLTVNVYWADRGGVLSGTPKRTVTIPTTGTATISAATDIEISQGDNLSPHVSVGVRPGTGYRIDHAPANIMVRTNRALPLLSIVAEPLHVNEGEPITFTLTADPPPAYELTVILNWTQPNRFAQVPPRTAKMPTTGTTSFVVATLDNLIDDYGSDFVSGAVEHNRPHYVAGQPGYAVVTVVDDETHDVTVVADSASVDEGSPVSFTLTATPAPTSDRVVNLAWNVVGDALSGTPPQTATIPTSGTVTVTLNTIDDEIDNTQDTTVDVQVQPGDGYTPASPPFYFSDERGFYHQPERDGDPAKATVTVLDNDDD